MYISMFGGEHACGGARSKLSLWCFEENLKAKAHSLLLTAKLTFNLQMENIPVKCKLGKQHIGQNSASLSGHMQPFCQSIWWTKASRFKLKLINYRVLCLTRLCKALHIKLVTCLEQIVLFTFSTAVQSVLSSLYIFFRCAHIKLAYCCLWMCLSWV